MERVRVLVWRTAPASRKSVRWFFALVLVVAAVVALPRPALAGWPLASHTPVSLGFGSSYRNADGTTSTHRGVDIPAGAGTEVVAPLGGEVTFVGRIPGASGGTVLAVTVVTSRGSLTLMPLETASVKRGGVLPAGDPVGTLAEAGDPSTPGSHLHVGTRRGDLYVDPLGIISPPVALPAGTPQPVPTPSTAPLGAEGAALTGKAATVLPRPQAGVHPAPAAEQAPAPAALKPAAPGARLGEGVSIPGVSPLAAAAGAATAVGLSGASSDSGVRAVDGRTPLERMASDLGSELSSVARAVARGHSGAMRVAALGALGVLLALGMLWPLWRRDRKKGSVQVGVSAVREDVAAAVGR
jgi:hypothetical protein